MMCITLNIHVDTHNFVHISVSEFSCNAKIRIFSLQIHMYIIIYIVVQKYKEFAEVQPFCWRLRQFISCNVNTTIKYRLFPTNRQKLQTTPVLLVRHTSHSPYRKRGLWQQTRHPKPKQVPHQWLHHNQQSSFHFCQIYSYFNLMTLL